jgi:hypothetical protein
MEFESGPTFPLSDNDEVPVYKLSVGPEDVKRAHYESLITGGADSDSSLLFFLSVHFNQRHPIGRHYDLKSPWCYPVLVNEQKTIIKRQFGRDGEIPRYALLSKLPEYNPVEGRG